jgi:glycerol-3-phosphate acyltransferase PlsY
MYLFWLFICLCTAYLAGSINFAILLTRLARGVDIRTLGNRNPGTANVGREVGKGWAFLVLVGDLAKGVIPLWLAKRHLFPADHYADLFPLFLTGMAAITGHCWPLYHRFRGGGGLATSIGVYMFFIPAEFLVTLLISYFAVQIFFRKKLFPFGQIIPMFFVSLAPVIVTASSLIFDTGIAGFVKVGGYSWYILVGVFILSAYLFLINIRIVRKRMQKN